MNREETSKILTYVKTAYPANFKDMSRDDMMKMLSLWERKFKDIPAELVFMAVDELIETKSFPPSVSDVKERLGDIYWDNFMYKWAYDSGTLLLSTEEKNRVEFIHNSLMQIADKENSLLTAKENKTNLLGVKK